MTRALLLAAGEQTRWQHHLGVPKHLIPIAGEPLLHRTTRQLAHAGITDIRVLARPEDAPAYVTPPATWERPADIDRGWVQEMEPSRHLWDTEGRTLVVYGDCYLTDALVADVTAWTGGWAVWGRYGASSITGKPWGEMFAWSIPAADHDHLDQALDQAIHARDTGASWRACGWETYRALMGWDLTVHRTDTTRFREWSDESDDFDYPRDWDTWTARTGIR